MIFSLRAKLLISASAVFFFMAAFILYAIFNFNRSPAIHIDDSISKDMAVKILARTNKDFYNDDPAKKHDFNLFGKTLYILVNFSKTRKNIYISKVHLFELYEVYYDVNYDTNYNQKIPRKYIVDKNYNILNEEYIGNPIY